ncbi:hypothetical protein MKW94_019040 [Papaver nudicaule]|uniref:Uncharacterized protein n=1 Tax=Papaver nudicaule TaxID=74823 RepID=A0AA41V8P2_PAPNU|nr:hypothetical protein [Papaver nudicaule]
MALRNAVKILSRGFSTGAGSTKIGREIEARHSFIENDRLRRMCIRIDQNAHEVEQLSEEFNAYRAFRRAFPRDQVIWLGCMLSLGLSIADQVAEIRSINAQLSAPHTERQELPPHTERQELPMLA